MVVVIFLSISKGCQYPLDSVGGHLGFKRVMHEDFLGGEKYYYESTSAILFWNTPKVNILHYSYIFSNSEPFGTELNNVSCYKLGNILYLEIQNSKEAKNTS